MRLEHVHKVLVMLCLASLFSAIPGVTRVSADDPPLPKLKITTGMDGSESYCLGQTIELAALVTDADDPSFRPPLVTVTIVDDTDTRKIEANSEGFVHWQYKPKGEGTHSIRLEAVGGLRLPADPVTFSIEVKRCTWELTLIYVEVGSLDLEEAGEIEFDGSVDFKTTFSADEDGKIVSSPDPGNYQVKVGGICQLQGQPSGPIAIAVTGSVTDGLDIQLSAPSLSLGGTRAYCGMVKTGEGEMPAEMFTSDTVDLISRTDIGHLFFPLEGGSFSKELGRALFWPEYSSATGTVTVDVSRVDE